MSLLDSAGISRRNFIIGAGAGATTLALGLFRLEPRAAGAELPATGLGATPDYNQWTDLWRARWTWDRVAKGTHTRANCISACSWNLFVKDGIVWKEEQNAVYERPRMDVPDSNPRGCQKGACYSDLESGHTRLLYPLKRAGERGEGKWQRLSWDQAYTEIADKLIDAAVAEGTESIVYDHGTTNAGYGPETAGEMRFTDGIGATVLDSWSGVGDMPMGCVQTWGMYNCEGTSDDWFRSDYIIVWIGNPVYTRIPDAHFMYEARYRGAKVVVIAPDYNATAIHADMWLNLKPETDAALGLAAAKVIIDENLYKADHVREQTDLPILVREDTGRFLRQADLEAGGADNLFYFWDEATGKPVPVPGCEGDGGRSIALGALKPALTGSFTVKLADGKQVTVQPVFERLRAQLAQYTLEKASAITRLSPAIIRQFAHEVAAANNAMIFASWGSCKHHHSDLFQRTMILLLALTGNQGKPGSGLRVAAWWALDGQEQMTGSKMSTMDMLRVIPKAIRGLQPRDYEQLYTQYSETAPNTPLMPFLYVHGGYRELWSRADLADPALPRGMDEFMRLSIERGWTKIHPRPDRRPRAFIFTGSNPLRRWPAPQYAKKHFFKKLDTIVSVNFRMSTTTMYADYVLPNAGYYEQHGIKYAQSYVPYVILSDQAAKPRGEAKPTWEMFGLLAERVSQRARERNVGSVRGFNDAPLDLTKAYEHFTAKGHYDPHDPQDPVKMIDDIMSRSPSVGKISGAEAVRLGVVRITGPARPSPVYATSSDYDPKDTYWPHRWYFEDKVPWPTLTGRQQFYIDHEWYLEAGEALPVHKEPPNARSKYPLHINGGHTRWSIHAIWRDHRFMLRLQRGEPACFVSPVDCAPRSINDGDRIRVYNDAGEFQVIAKVSPSVQPGEVIIYHAWEPFQFKNWKGQQEPVEAPWKAIHLAGGYGHIHYRMFYGSPGHAPRGAPVEMERA